MKLARDGAAARIKELQAEIDAIRKAFGADNAETDEMLKKHKKSKISAEGRARIAAAQRKRWAKIKKAKEA